VLGKGRVSLEMVLLGVQVDERISRLRERKGRVRREIMERTEIICISGGRLLEYWKNEVGTMGRSGLSVRGRRRGGISKGQTL
jgi:hypothetical protein